MKLYNKKSGIALVTLIITIIIVIILASVGIGIVINKNYFGKAEDMKFSSNIRNYMEELYDYIENEEFLNNSRYNQEELFADENGIYYNGEKIENKTIKDIITTISDDDLKDVKIYKGSIVYVGGTKKYQEQINGVLSYFDEDNMIANISKNVDDNTKKIEEVQANINDTSFTVEVIYKEINTTNNDKYNFIYSDKFYIRTQNQVVVLGNQVESKSSNFKLRKDKIDKITFTYDNNESTGTLYVNGNKVVEKKFTNKLNQFSKIYLKGNKNYFEIRVYDKCLNYSQIKQNDTLDILKYGMWSDN